MLAWVSKADRVSTRLLLAELRPQRRVAVSTKPHATTGTPGSQKDFVLNAHRDDRQSPFHAPDLVVGQAQWAGLRTELRKPALCHDLSEAMALAWIETVQP